MGIPGSDAVEFDGSCLLSESLAYTVCLNASDGMTRFNDSTRVTMNDWKLESESFPQNIQK